MKKKKITFFSHKPSYWFCDECILIVKHLEHLERTEVINVVRLTAEDLVPCTVIHLLRGQNPLYTIHIV